MPRTALTSTATLARGTAWNIAGRVLLLLVALAATPFLVQALGLARWGVFTLALGLVGLFGVFDLGVGRALTRMVAARLAEGEAGREVAGVVQTGLLLLAALGLAAGLACAAGAWAFAGLLDLPSALQAEARWALVAMAAAAPLVLVNAGLWGVLAAQQRFAGANLANLPILALYYLGPLGVLRLWDSLLAAVLVLVACRAAMTWAYWRLCLRGLPELGTARPDPAAALPLLRQGGWMTVSAVLAPASQHLDRFIIAARLSAEAVAHYATPFDIVVRIAVLGQAVLAGVFPALSAALATDPAAAGRLFRHAMLAILALVLPPCLVCLLLADLLLAAWLGEAFAGAAAPAARWLAAGVVLFALDGVAAALIDGAGRAARNAGLAIAELALYLPALLLALAGFGIAGAAAAWALRMLVAMAARLALARGAHPALVPELQALAPVLLGALGTLAAGLALAELPLPARLGLLAVLPVPVALLAWHRGLVPGERAAIMARVALAGRNG